MKRLKLFSFVLATFLQLAPIALRGTNALPLASSSPAAVILQWIVSALAVAGTYHTVSAASAVLVSATSIQGKIGSRLSYQIKISDGESRHPESWVIEERSFSNSGSTTFGMPPGLSLSLSTSIISGVPTQGGTFPVTITAYETANRRGAELAFTLTFTISGGTTPPNISVQPIGTTALQGTTVILSVLATGSAPLSYQWKHDGTALPNASTATLTLGSVQPSDAGSYTVTVSNAAGTITSNPATLSVTPLTTAPAISIQPTNVTLHSGESLKLQSTVSGGEPLTWQWKRDGLDVPGQTNAVLSLATTSAGDEGSYTLVVSTSAGTATSEAAAVSVVPLTIQLPTLDFRGVSLTLNTIPGRAYAIEATDVLNPAEWQLVKQQAATGNTMVFSEGNSTRAQRFWRYHPVP